MNETWGWEVKEDGIVPVWYNCSQFPPNENQQITDCLDDEESEIDCPNNISYGDDSTISNYYDSLTFNYDEDEEYSTDDTNYNFDDDSDDSEDSNFDDSSDESGNEY